MSLPQLRERRRQCSRNRLCSDSLQTPGKFHLRPAGKVRIDGAALRQRFAHRTIRQIPLVQKRTMLSTALSYGKSVLAVCRGMVMVMVLVMVMLMLLLMLMVCTVVQTREAETVKGGLMLVIPDHPSVLEHYASAPLP